MDFQVSYSSDYVNSSSHIDARMRSRGGSYGIKRNLESTIHYATKEDIVQKQKELKIHKAELARLRSSLGITGESRFESRKSVDDLDYISRIIDEVTYKIECCDDFIRHAQIIDLENRDTSVISILSNVRVLILNNDQDMIFKIAGASQSVASFDCISCMSPVGKALLGHRVGDVVTVEVPSGKLNLQIQEIY